MSDNQLPADSAARKNIPLARGVLDYFPAALAAVAELSRAGNEKHNPGEELHHARGKSTDHADCILRHLVDRGTVDPEDEIRHSVKVAWRALALLQEELEGEGAPLARGARLPELPGFTASFHGDGPNPIDPDPSHWPPAPKYTPGMQFRDRDTGTLCTLVPASAAEDDGDVGDVGYLSREGGGGWHITARGLDAHYELVETEPAKPDFDAAINDEHGRAEHLHARQPARCSTCWHKVYGWNR